MILAARNLRRNEELGKRLVVVSNRVPFFPVKEHAGNTREQAVGGLVSALRPVLEKRGGLWFGWSGKTISHKNSGAFRLHPLGSFTLLTMDFSENEVKDFYTEFCNRTLWPLFHGFLGYMKLDQDKYRTYRVINRRIAFTLIPFLRRGDLVWVHDYHLLPLGTELRKLGWTGHLGFFLHIPFPPVNTFNALPWGRPILRGLLDYDLIGFHTQQYCHDFIEALRQNIGGFFDGQTYWNGLSSLRIGAYPIGIDPDGFKRRATSRQAIRFGDRLRRMVRGQRIVLGVDRLDYTKGIPERLLAFERLLECYPCWRGHVLMIQISAPSRTQVPEYMTHRQEVDRLVARVNQRFATEAWTPIRHLYRSCSQEELSAFYREADVCLVTPLRDGMNLVAKEYVASHASDPGILVLSRFCGAAEELREAIIVNPYDIHGMSQALKEALEMSLAERKGRWESLTNRVWNQTALTWSNRFLADLVEAKAQSPRGAMPRKPFLKYTPVQTRFKGSWNYHD